MTDVVMIDWLGRGGTAQVTESWRRTLVEGGLSTVVVSRTSATMRVSYGIDRRIGGLVGGIDAHVRLVKLAAEVIRSTAPRMVYVQNYWLPPLEMPVAAASQAVGARLVVAVHNDRPHNRGGGSVFRLRALLAAADDLVVHSQFVGDRVRAGTSRPVTVIGLPLPASVLETEPAEVPELTQSGCDKPRTAVTFGVLGKRYKGGRALDDVPALLKSDWRVAAAGVGAGGVRAATAFADRFLSEAELHWLLAKADVSLLPYRSATQSAAVMLSQALGAPPIASAVGGIPEQIEDGRTGLLLPSRASASAWAAALDRVAQEPKWWDQVKVKAALEVQRRHEGAAAALLDFVRG